MFNELLFGDEWDELSEEEKSRLHVIIGRDNDGNVRTIAVGSDADIAIWDPDLEVTISSAMLHDNVDYTPYEGRVVKGWPVTTLSRGEVVWDGTEPRGTPGRGRFLPCDFPEAARPRGIFPGGFDPETGATGESSSASSA